MKIDLILQSLPKHFNQFKVNYNMHKMDLTPVQLMHELESADNLSQSQAVSILRRVLLNLKGNLRVETRTRKRRQ